MYESQPFGLQLIFDQNPTGKVFIFQVFKEAVAMYGTKPCLGVRDIIETQEEVQSDGKVFKKVRGWYVALPSPS